MNNSVIITAAVTGTVVTSQSPYIPITPDEIAREAYLSYQEGASIIHIHVRDSKDGHPIADIGTFQETVQKIKEKCGDVVICLTTGGGVGMTREERTQIIPVLKPEIASFSTGSMNFGLFPVVPKIKKFEHEWERPYLESTRDFVFKNTFADLEYISGVIKENHTKPEIEIFDGGHLFNTYYLVKKGLVDLPVHLQFVTGVLGGIGSRRMDLEYLVRTADELFCKNYTWSVVGIGYPAEFSMVALATLMGGHVRVGLEDNIYIEKGVYANGNAQLVAKARKIIEELGKKVANVQETREILGLKGLDKVNF